MKVLAYTRPDGGCSIVHLTWRKMQEGETEQEFIERVKLDIPSDAINITELDDAQLPYGGYRDLTKTRSIAMRNSWRNPADTTSPPVVDMDIARQAKMDLEWRPARNEMLKELDVDYQRADEEGDLTRKTAIADEKRKLRDMPVDFDTKIKSIETPEELDSYSPVVELIINSEI
jgi:hypothetical protein